MNGWSCLLAVTTERSAWFVALVETAAEAIELVGVAIIVVSGAAALVQYGRETLRSETSRLEAYRELRLRVGRGLLLGLEFLVAADIIATVLISPTLRSVAALGLLVVVRTFLSWSIEVELHGRWPWQGEQGMQRTSAVSEGQEED